MELEKTLVFFNLQYNIPKEQSMQMHHVWRRSDLGEKPIALVWYSKQDEDWLVTAQNTHLNLMELLEIAQWMSEQEN